MLTKIDGTKIVRRWECYSDFLADATNTKPPADAKSSREPSTGWKDGWYGEEAETWEKGLRVASEGWAKAEEAIKRMGASILPKVGMTFSQTVRMDIPAMGGMLDIGTFLSGDPECYITPTEDIRFTKGSFKVTKVVMDYATSAGVSSDVMTRRGIAALVLCDVLERYGFPVEFWGVCGLARGSACMDYAVKLKGAGEWFDLKSLSFSIAHPAVFRRLTFAIMESENAEARRAMGVNTRGGYGSLREHPMCAEADVKVPNLMLGSTAAFASDANAVKWIRETLEKIGVTVSKINE